MGRLTGRLSDIEPEAPVTHAESAPARTSGELPLVERKLCGWWGGDLRRPYGCGEWYEPPHDNGVRRSFWEFEDGRIHPAICCRTCADRLAFNPDSDETADAREERKWAAIAELRKLSCPKT